MSIKSEIATSYTDSFYKQMAVGAVESAREIVPIILDLFPHINSVIDLGCGPGAWLAEFKKLGKEITGIDFGEGVSQNLMFSPQYYIKKDLSTAIELNQKFDLCLSLEVAEHLPEQCADIFITNLVNLSDLIIFSAAMPGQGGTNHINLQYPEFWIKLFYKHDYICRDILRGIIWENKKVRVWYRQNILIFIKKSSRHLIAQAESMAKFNLYGLPLIHPELFILKINRLKRK
ncbi:MAG: methyltransferase domain-containing protein [Clostridia bacterium]|nr:methyltransferase domain-containing protein [Clostridia bacterium]